MLFYYKKTLDIPKKDLEIWFKKSLQQIVHKVSYTELVQKRAWKTWLQFNAVQLMTQKVVKIQTILRRDTWL